MKKTFERFSRIVALVLLVTFSFISCPVPSYDPFSPVETPLTLTPGVGTPCSFYLDSEGNYIETEAGGTGRTGLVVEDNKLAEGAVIYSDDTDYEDRVAFLYGDSIVSMFFKKDSNFPYRMAISDGSDTYYAYLSQYNAVSHDYYITFLHNSIYNMMGQVILNGNIFSLYQNDPELSDSQNRRMANMTIAMGVWGSLYATFEDAQYPITPVSRKISASSVFKGVAAVFTYVAVAATVVAYVVAPVVSFVNPVAGLAVASVAIAVVNMSTLIAAAAMRLAYLFEEKEDGGHTPPPIITSGGPMAVYVSRVEPDGKEVRIKYNDNGIHEEFHIEPEKEIVIVLYMPFGDFSDITTSRIYNNFMFIDEPGVRKGASANTGHFEEPPGEVMESNDPEKLFIKIRRTSMPGYNGDGKINFGFVFNDENGNPVDIVVNDYSGGFKFRLALDNEPVLYKNMVVIHFCEIVNCPDIKVTK